VVEIFRGIQETEKVETKGIKASRREKETSSIIQVIIIKNLQVIAIIITKTIIIVSIAIIKITIIIKITSQKTKRN